MRSSKARQRLLIVTRHYAPEPVGSGPVLQELAEWFAGEGRPTEVLTVRPSYPNAAIVSGYETGQRDVVVENDVKVRRLPTWPVKAGGVLTRTGPEIRFFLDILVRRLTGQIGASNAVISLCPSILAVTAATMLKTRGGQHIALVHDIPSGLAAMLGVRARGFISLLRMLEAWSLNRADHVVVLSTAMMRALRQLGVTTPISVLPPPLDTSRLRPLPRPAGVPFTLLYSGTLGRKQGLEQLLDVAIVLRKKAPAIRVVICGEGPCLPFLERSASYLGLTNIHFWPLVPKDQVERSFAEGDIHLVPQIDRGGDFAVPSKVFAIMAAGRPFVATAEPGSCLADLAASSGAGIVTPPRDPEAFVDAILSLANDPYKRQEMGNSGRRYVEIHADTEVVMQSIACLLSENAAIYHQPPRALPVERDLSYDPVNRNDAIQ